MLCECLQCPSPGPEDGNEAEILFSDSKGEN